MVTARHVLDDGEVELIEPEHYASPRSLEIVRTFVPDDPRIDLAVLETNFSLQHFMEMTTIVQGRYQRPKVDAIPLGGHLDDWIDDGLVLTRALTMGYPSVPLSSRSQLIASTGEVNGVIDRYDRPYVHFAVSTMGRGGFSGGPVISEYGFLLGVYTGMFSENFSATGGLPGALSVEPLLNLLDENGIYPGDTNGPFLRELYSGLGKPLEEILSSPNVTVEGNAEALTEADRRKHAHTAEKRAANPRYQPPTDAGRTRSRLSLRRWLRRE